MSILSLLSPKKTTQPNTGLRLVEGVESVWNYHLAHGPTRQALCNPKRTMMDTSAPLDTWGFRSHVPSSYCRDCERIAIERDLGLPVEVRRTAQAS